MEKVLLLVDDEPDISRSLTRELRKEGYRILIAESGQQGLEILANNEVQVILSDQRMPQMTGSEFLARVRERYPDTVRMVLSGYADFESVQEAINDGAIYKFISKPWNNEILVSEIREAFHKQFLETRNSQLSKIFDSTIEAIVLINEQGIIQTTNPAFEVLTGHSEQESTGRPIDNYLTIEDQVLEDTQFREDAPSSHEPSAHKKISQYLVDANEWHGELVCYRSGNSADDQTEGSSDGGEFPIWMTVTPISQGRDKGTHYAALFIDISEQKQREARIEYQAFHDELTGLANRRLLKNHLDIALAQSMRYKTLLATLFIDLDRFKYINDSLGHEVGDIVLQSVAKRLQNTLRRGETIARFGGDEFVALLPCVNDVDVVKIVAQKILFTFDKPICYPGGELFITPSIGISLFPQDGGTAELLLKHADAAMYKAKRLGRNTFAFFNAQLHQLSASYITTSNALHQAIKQHQLVSYYQPQISLRQNCVIGAEALVRWLHPEKGIIMPDNFIGVAEDNSLIKAIGTNMLTNACQHIENWIKSGVNNIRIAVNVSARQFTPELVEVTRELLARYKVPAGKLEYEVTESLFQNDLQDTINIINQLKQLGIRIALDDFGTGYASLNYLRKLPIDILKIDQCFICDLPADKAACAIVLAILQMAKGLGMEVIAEGIETEAQMIFLRDNGCDIGQGYLFSKPIDHHQFTQFIKDKY